MKSRNQTKGPSDSLDCEGS